ncbi:5776_t:CDS:2, partial [Scutellospora calospora]
NIYRKVQAAHLTTRYGTDEDFSIKICQIPALAFLPPGEIPNTFDELKGHIPEEVNPIIRWFEETYIHRQFMKIMNMIFLEQIILLRPSTEVQLDIAAISQEAPRPSQKRQNDRYELQIKTVLDNRENRLLMDFLEGITHNLSL